MSEGPSDPHRRLFVVPAPEVPVADPTQTEMDVAMSAAHLQTIGSVGKWAAYVQLDWPAGVEQHPNIGRYLLRKLDRVCGIDCESENFGFIYALRGELPEEAEADANELLVNILEWLGLGHTAVTNCALVPLL